MPEDRPFTLSARRIAFLLLGSALLFVSGCTGTPHPVLSPPPVSLGPVLDVLRVETGSDTARLLPDSSGRIHAFIASSRTKRLYHVTVLGNEVSEPETVLSGVSPSRIGAAFDRSGRLHLLLDAEHLVRGSDGWQASDAAPWEGTGIDPSWADFVPGAPELVWAFEVDGSDLGAAMRMDIYGFGGYGGGIIWPWFTRGSRLVLTGESHPDCWNVVELPGRYDSWPIALAAGPQGFIHFTYSTSLGGMLHAPNPHYAHLQVGELAPNPTNAPEAKTVRIGGRNLRLQNVRGKRVPPPNPKAGPMSLPVAVDPETGTTLLGMGLLIRGDMYTDAPGTSLGENAGYRAHIAPAGRDAFHAMQNGSYRLLSGLEWSAPLVLGNPETASFWGTPWDAVGLAGTGDGRAFSVWPVPRGVVGRWIEQKIPNATDSGASDAPMWALPDPDRPEPFPPVHIVIAAPDREQNLERRASVRVNDARNATEFRRTTILDTLMSSIALYPPIPEIVRRIVETSADRALRAQSCTGSEPVECDIVAFDIRTPATMLYWDVETRLELSLHTRGRYGKVSVSVSERTFLWPSGDIISRVVHEALRQAGEKTEEELRGLLTQ